MWQPSLNKARTNAVVNGGVHIEVHYGNLPAGEDTNLVLGSVFQYGLSVDREGGRC